MHLSIAGWRIKTVPSRLSAVDLARLRHNGARPAGPPPAGNAPGPLAATSCVEVQRLVNGAGIITLGTLETVKQHLNSICQSAEPSAASGNVCPANEAPEQLAVGVRGSRGCGPVSRGEFQPTQNSLPSGSCMTAT